MDEPYLRFEACIPHDAQMPVKPTKDLNTVTMKRRVRIWIDAFLDPGDTEKTLLLADETFDVTITRKPKVVIGSVSVVGDPA